jgi:hypothetical protein
MLEIVIASLVTEKRSPESIVHSLVALSEPNITDNYVAI